jgi:hypothetical protein
MEEGEREMKERERERTREKEEQTLYSGVSSARETPITMEHSL